MATSFIWILTWTQLLASAASSALATASFGQLASTAQSKGGAAAGQKVPPGPGHISEAEIQKLIAGLGHANFKEREQATAKLTAIGLPALGALQKAAEKGDTETRLRSKSIIKKLNAVYVNGLVFRVIVDTEWVAWWGEPTYFPVNLEVTNMADKAVRLNFMKMKLGIQDEKEKWLGEAEVPFGRGENSDRISPPLKKGESTTVSCRVRILTTGVENMRISCGNGFYAATSCKQGRYYLTVFYSNYIEFGDEGDPFWVGSMESPSAPVAISYSLPKAKK